MSPNDPFATSNHEIGHCVVALWFGFTVREIRIDRPDDFAGIVTLEPEETLRAFERLAVSLAGPIAEGRPLQWPPRSDVAGDSTSAALFVRFLKLDQDGFDDAAALAGEILRLPHVRRASREIAIRLADEPVLDGAEAKRIYDAAADARAS